MTKVNRCLLVCASTLLVITTIIRLMTCIPSWSQINHVSAVWISLAQELLRGTLYRPIESALGYGGIRYAPLHFVLHSLGMTVVGNPIQSGFILTGIAAILTFSGFFYLLRSFGVRRALCFFFTILLLAPSSIQYALTTIRGDLLPVGFSLWGLYFFKSSQNEHPFKRTALSALLCSLAFLTKVTSLGAFIAISCVLIFKIKIKNSISFLMIFFGIVLISLGFIQFFSHGNFFHTFTSVAPMGTQFSLVLRAPISLFRSLLMSDLMILFVAIIALSGLVQSGVGALKQLEWQFLIWTSLMTLVIFATPGVDYNHFIDLYVAVLFIVALQIETLALPLDLTLHLLAVSLFFISPYLFWKFSLDDRKQTKTSIRDVLKEINERALNQDQSILTDHSLINVVEGKPPYVLDFYSFGIFTSQNPRWGEKLAADLKRQAFRAVVLKTDLSTPEGRSYVGPILSQHLGESYYLNNKVGEFFIYFPIHFSQKQ